MWGYLAGNGFINWTKKTLWQTGGGPVTDYILQSHTHKHTKTERTIHLIYSTHVANGWRAVWWLHNHTGAFAGKLLKVWNVWSFVSRCARSQRTLQNENERKPRQTDKTVCVVLFDVQWVYVANCHTYTQRKSLRLLCPVSFSSSFFSSCCCCWEHSRSGFIANALTSAHSLRLSIACVCVWGS